ncbi:MAG TPA: acetyl-CoA C-acyltransferase family protein [Gammaproteobacteria bacterium]
MADQREVVVLSGVRTAIGDYGGSLKDLGVTELGAIAVREAIARANVDPAQVSHGVIGSVIHGEAKDMYVSRVACVNGGMSHDSQALTVNRLCGSGLQAIVSAAQLVLLGDADIALGGGAESMSRAAYALPAARWGARMGDNKMIDMMVGALTDPFATEHMGLTAERVADKWGLSREAQDAFSVESHQRAARAIAEGRFKDQIVPVTIKGRKGDTIVDTDEHVRGDVTVEGLAKLRAAFKKDGSVTAGNASGINDGAAAVVLAEAAVAAKAGLKPLGRLVSYGFAGVDPAYMGEGPIPAVKVALQRAGLNASDLDVIESNEAFAVQALAVSCDLKFDPKKTNPNGGAVGLGHPIGATGAVLTVKALYELQRTGGRYAVVTMCIGGGQGIAAVFERMQ